MPGRDDNSVATGSSIPARSTTVIPAESANGLFTEKTAGMNSGNSFYSHVDTLLSGAGFCLSSKISARMYAFFDIY